MILNARPTPHVLVLAVVATKLHDTCCQCPQDHAHDEPTDGEKGVVDANLLRPLVATTAVADEDEDANSKRNAGGSQDKLLWP